MNTKIGGIPDVTRAGSTEKDNAIREYIIGEMACQLQKS